MSRSNLASRVASATQSGSSEEWRQLAAQTRPRGGGSRGGSYARRGYNQRRFEQHRDVTNKIVMTSMQEALDRKYHYDEKGLESILSQVEAVPSPAAVPLPVTSRGILFSLQYSYSRLQNQNRIIWAPIYSYVRVVLACAYVKLMTMLRHQHAVPTYQDEAHQIRQDSNLISLVSAHPNLFRPVKRIIQSLGPVLENGKTYLPYLPMDKLTRVGHRYVPVSENVHLKNLEQTVDALSNDATPAAIRERFYQHNPLPGAIWNDDAEDRLLLNPADFVPQGGITLDLLTEDFEAVSRMVSSCERKVPQMIDVSPWNFEHPGAKGLLLSNDQGSLRCRDATAQGIQDRSYFSLGPEGNVHEYWTSENIPKSDLVNGVLLLAGELPVVETHHFPNFVVRNPRTASLTFDASYRSIMDLVFNS